MLTKFLAKFLIGREGAAPAAVRLARATLEVAVLAGLGFLAVELTRIDWGEAAPLSLVAFWIVQQLEGLADQYIDPTQNRTTTSVTRRGELGQVNLGNGISTVAFIVVVVFILFLTERAGLTNFID